MTAQFTPTKWATAEDKEKWYKAFIRFVESGYARPKFTKKLYTQLSNMFGHIAHYNIDGFYETWFSDPAAKLRFVKHCQEHPLYGDPAWTWVDVERQIKYYFDEHPPVSKRIHRVIADQLTAEEAKNLLEATEKLGIPAEKLDFGYQEVLA